MTQNERNVAIFETRVRQLLLKFKQLQDEQDELYAALEDNEKSIKELKAQLSQKDQDYEALKMARMIEVSDRDIEQSKRRLSKLIREVNKCITILSGEQ